MPGAVWVNNARNAGGTYADGQRYKIVLHTVEGALGTLSSSLPASHQFPPHAWYDPSTRRLYQTVPLDRSAFALYQGNGPPANKARALQVELAGTAATAGDWPDEYLLNIARDVIVPLCRWVEQQGAHINLDHVPAIGTIGGSASEHAPQRLSYEAWEQLDGLASHRHVPDNDHWDTGTLNIPRLVELAKELLGGALGPAAQEDELSKQDALDAIAETVEPRLQKLEENVHAWFGQTHGAVLDRIQKLEVNVHQWMEQARGRETSRERALNEAAVALRDVAAKLADAAPADKAGQAPP